MRNNKASSKNNTVQTAKELKTDGMTKAMEQIDHLKQQSNKAFKDLKTGFDRVVRDVKDTTEKVASDFS